jgi:hypothetical protein
MCVILIWIEVELTMSSSSGVANGCGRYIVRRCGRGRGRGGLGGGV